MDVDDLKRFRACVARLDSMIGGKAEVESIETEEISRLNARRSIVLDADVARGDAHVQTAGDGGEPGALG